MDIIWLASYPRSGNTWLRSLIYHYLHGTPTSTADIENAIPNLHRMIHQNKRFDETNNKQFLCKSHYCISSHHLYLNNTVGFIYILRHPKDVLISAINYFQFTQNNPLDEIGFCERFIKNMGVARWQAIGIGTWVEHITKWMNASTQYPHLFLCYEDMLKNPEAALTSVVQFLGQPIDNRRINESVSACKPDKLRQMEMNEKKLGLENSLFVGSYNAAQQGHTFVNQCVSGQKLSHIATHLDAKFDKRFSSVLKLFGY